jgi:hypothetical protein
MIFTGILLCTSMYIYMYMYIYIMMNVNNKHLFEVELLVNDSIATTWNRNIIEVV